MRDQLHHRRRISRRKAAKSGITGRRRSYHRQDIIRFHAVYWPAFLMSAAFRAEAGLRPRLSCSTGANNVEIGRQRRRSLQSRRSIRLDQMRYFFLREVPFGQDGNYNHEAIVARINADLANDLGNLAQRSLSMIAKQLAGVLPEPGPFAENDKPILAQADGMIALARTAMHPTQFTRRSTPSGRSSRSNVISRRGTVALGQDRSAAPANGAVCDAEVIARSHSSPNRRSDASAMLLDSLAIPEGERDCAALGEQRASSRASFCLRRYRFSALRRAFGGVTNAVDSHCHSIFRILPTDLDAIVARAEAAELAYRHDLHPREAFRCVAGDRDAFSKRLLLRRHPSAPCR